MGNCLCHQSLVKVVGQDQGSLACDTCDIEMKNNINEERDLGNKGGTITSSTTEIKIKITKKQLEELLSRVNMNELSVQQVLAQLMNVSSDRYEAQQRSWRPALQSIPE